MRYAAVDKRDSEQLDQFVRRKGGINACAARFLGAGRRHLGVANLEPRAEAGEALHQ